MDVEEITDTYIMVDKLYEIAMSTDDAEIGRIAMSGLTNTEAGRQYLQANPITV